MGLVGKKGGVDWVGRHCRTLGAGSMLFYIAETFLLLPEVSCAPYMACKH